MELNPYDVLGVSTTASQVEIKAAFRAKLKKYHPDTYVGSKADAEARTRCIIEAYKILSDANSRKKFDEERRAEEANSPPDTGSTNDDQDTRNHDPKPETLKRDYAAFVYAIIFLICVGVWSFSLDRLYHSAGDTVYSGLKNPPRHVDSPNKYSDVETKFVKPIPAPPKEATNPILSSGKQEGLSTHFMNSQPGSVEVETKFVRSILIPPKDALNPIGNPGREEGSSTHFMNSQPESVPEITSEERSCSFGNEFNWHNCIGISVTELGTKFVGYYKNGRRNGLGTCKSPDGSSTFRGFWKDGILEYQIWTNGERQYYPPPFGCNQNRR